jgi:AcrR family transcriptional regulator
MRTVKPAKKRQEEILVRSAELFARQGYESTSIQDIIGAVGIAKGTFYHHFRSKEDLLDRLIDSMLAEAVDTLERRLGESGLDAAARLELFFSGISAWKLSHRSFFLDLAKVLWREENALLLHKVWSTARRRLVPLLGQLIRQGVSEGLFETDRPDETAALILGMARETGACLSAFLDSRTPGDTDFAGAKNFLLAYREGIARLLGAPPDRLHVFDPAILDSWLDVAETPRRQVTAHDGQGPLEA